MVKQLQGMKGKISCLRLFKMIWSIMVTEVGVALVSTVVTGKAS